MRFQLSLKRLHGRVLPINYQYPLSAAIYKVISRADRDFAEFLHGDAYLMDGRNFKLFCFSPLQFQPYRLYKEEQRIEMLGEEAALGLSFMMDEAAERFIRGLFMNQVLEIGDKISAMSFEVGQIQTEPLPAPTTERHYNLLSPCVISRRTEQDRYAQYLAPEDPVYGQLFINNLCNKLRSSLAHSSGETDGYGCATGIQECPEFEFEVSGRVKRKGITIKAHTADETRIIGYEYAFRLRAPLELHETMLAAGAGEKGSLGFGWVRERN